MVSGDAETAYIAPMNYDVWLLDARAGRLNVVKIVKTLTGVGLAEAVAMVDALGVITKGVSREEAEAIEAQLIEAGATVAITAQGESPTPST